MFQLNTDRLVYHMCPLKKKHQLFQYLKVSNQCLKKNSFISFNNHLMSNQWSTLQFSIEFQWVSNQGSIMIPTDKAP